MCGIMRRRDEAGRVFAAYGRLYRRVACLAVIRTTRRRPHHLRPGDLGVRRYEYAGVGVWRSNVTQRLRVGRRRAHIADPARSGVGPGQQVTLSRSGFPEFGRRFSALDKYPATYGLPPGTIQAHQRHIGIFICLSFAPAAPRRLPACREFSAQIPLGKIPDMRRPRAAVDAFRETGGGM